MVEHNLFHEEFSQSSLSVNILIFEVEGELFHVEVFYFWLSDFGKERMVQAFVDADPSFRVKLEGFVKEINRISACRWEHSVEVLSRSLWERLEILKSLVISYEAEILLSWGSKNFENHIKLVLEGHWESRLFGSSVGIRRERETTSSWEQRTSVEVSGCVFLDHTCKKVSQVFINRAYQAIQHKCTQDSKHRFSHHNFSRLK